MIKREGLYVLRVNNDVMLMFGSELGDVKDAFMEFAESMSEFRLVIRDIAGNTVIIPAGDIKYFSYQEVSGIKRIERYE